jgi:hypothetical protein
VGKQITGGSVHEKDIELLTKDQKNFLKGNLKSQQKASEKAYSDLLKRPDTPDLDKMLKKSKGTYENLMSDKAGQQYWDMMAPTRQTYQDMMNAGTGQDAFKAGVVDPMMQQYNQQVLPSLQQRFVDANAGSSSALNQALSQSANDLTTQMGSMYLPFMQSQQQLRAQGAQGLQGQVMPWMQNQQNTQLQAAQGSAGLTNPYMSMYGTQMGGRQAALSGLGALAGQQAFTPLISQHEGVLGATMKAAGAYAASSEKVKENIKDYEKGLETLKEIDVKQYDYIPEIGGEKGKVGVIAEQVPEEVTLMLGGVLHVDMYGLLGITINAIKDLNKKVEELEKKLCQLHQ